MEYLALYRKYRPKDLDEVVGQSEIKKILASSIKNNTITHAYLFSGPRGTGKTTMAKILAKMVNCLNPVDGNACNRCENCQNVLNSNDIIEIDAASNNGVDEIRDLREKANLVPNKAKYKVYIIDEVHMLTTQAFNALLKTLEEPPKHVIFVLATTEYYKIPLTITSRCQKFQFSKLTNDEIVSKLQEISKVEKIKITDEALLEIAKISDGGMRDSINFLDQLRSFNNNKITIEDVYEVCGNISTEETVNLLKDVRKNNCENVTIFFEKMDTTGKNYNKFLEGMVEFLKDVVLFNKNVSQKYIKNELSFVKEVDSIFSIDEIFYMIECINELMSKLKNVSRQSVVVVTEFLLVMNEINKDIVSSDVTLNEKPVGDENNTTDESFNMAFQFTSTDDSNNLEDDVKLDSKTEKGKITNDNMADVEVNENKKIIINNAFAVANKELKNSLHEKLKQIDNYLTDKKFKVAAGTLIDAKLEVAGKEYLILSVPNEAVVQKIYNNLKLCSELIEKIFDNRYYFVVLSQEEWNKYRDEYVNNFKTGKKYTLKELQNTIISEEKKQDKSTVVDKLFELVGEDSVEFK